MFDATIVEVRTDAGHHRLWRVHARSAQPICPAYGPGVRTGIAEIGPKILGLDPRDLGVLNRRMDAVLRGHAYVKSRDRRGLLGHPRQGVRPAGLARCSAAAQQESVELYRAISQEEPEVMARKIAGYRAEGYAKFQLKVGGDADRDISPHPRVPRPSSSRPTCWSPTPTPAGPCTRRRAW